MPTKTLHVWLTYGWDGIWVEHHEDFEFTKRIKYIKEHGEFTEMLLEIAWEEKERYWYTFWKETTVVVTMWINSDYFENKRPHKKRYDSVIVDCA